MLSLGLSAVGATGAQAAEQLCIPILMTCSPDDPSTPLTDVGDTIGGLVGLGDETNSGLGAPLLVAAPDPNAPVMTLPAAQLGGSSLTINGLKAISLVTVPLADGSRAQVFKIEADQFVIDDFVLDVRNSTSPSLVSTSTQMRLTGNAVVYVDSVTASTIAGLGISLLAPTPPPGPELDLPSQLVGVHLGLVGCMADLIEFDDSHQHLYE
ncbi:MAG: hypothetical protein KKH51_02945 [Actinobacteria bacterium]|nr:hypothetical protein [Actinomycetota bacterium]